jgi:uncharacterized repeat protein (TIGR02543 family)
MTLKNTLTTTLLILLCSTFSLSQEYTITYNLDGGTASNPATYEQADITTTVTLGVYKLTMGNYVDDNKDLVYTTGDACQTWSRTTQEGDFHSDDPHLHFNAASNTSYDLATSAITWTEFGPEENQVDIDATCAAGLGGSTKTVNDVDYYSQGNFYLRIKSVEFSSILLADASKNGYVFEGWYKEAGFTNQITEIIDGTTGNLELFAKFSVTTGLLSASSAKEFSFYPNPNTGVIHTDLELSSLEILNAEGSVVSEFSTTEISYDISSLKSGVYIIKATDKEGALYTSKLIIK